MQPASILGLPVSNEIVPSGGGQGGLHLVDFPESKGREACGVCQRKPTLSLLILKQLYPIGTNVTLTVQLGKLRCGEMKGTPKLTRPVHNSVGTQTEICLPSKPVF